MNEEHLRTWIGSEESGVEMLPASLVKRFHATLDLPGVPASDGAPAPRLIHFCLCQPVAPSQALGQDGHPDRGGFLPPVDLPQRMWAASEMEFSGDLIVGEEVRRQSRVADVVVKSGRSGSLCFVTVEHAIEGAAGGAVRERQTIVYRASGKPDSASQSIERAPVGATVESVFPTPTLLFRYSALTFNGHRIHYDAPYATGVESYPGLVVHGPLQATLLFGLATRIARGAAPSKFSFRSVSALYVSDLISLHAGKPAEDELDLWSSRADGPIAMQAKASWNIS